MFNALRFLGWPLLVGLLVALLIIQRYPQLVGIKEHDIGLQQAPLVASAPQQGPYSYANAVAAAAPAVANLYTTKVIEKTEQQPLSKDPLFQRFFSDNLPRQRRMESSLGSAVIMSSEGYLLTNNHVTANAEQIVVALKDGRETLARVIGSDPETDLAVLKIDLADLPAITLGHSDRIRVGDVTLAIGNPFGVGQTVTMGIISATGRNQLGLNTYEDFIQTDAAINRGNSGGALVDAGGNLIGINTAIISESGGSQGIGFAIPVKLALEVMKSIIEHGQVIRGWLGVEVQSLTQELAESFGQEGRPGIVVAGVYRDGPAARAGLQPGDLILSIDGVQSADGRSSMNQVARARPGENIDIDILRNGKPLTLTAEVGMRPPVNAAPK
ncbi:Do family serine endopeptidase AlgW [Stutzerimonas kunmingensis]|mgnify:FL=1|jgi:serine protease DegS|uniref:Trypsin-like peptidase domain-containing protein n=1 Tax=Stutzerimonas kunmingensis TaxID=1211807 RepID=A0A9X1N340_9GAMM|nr:Do family serine endopeptidase AlgW [Stutzerimonas kunmingensis]KJS25614.1 MAG: 2-alkenal reductase [Pseudomonas sp. BRH_c35]MAK87010.1 2-alkenal reductase [Pseudomonas sp.]MBU2011360.1 trypsin-like peptidase domain-containing protein [Gammaproteobacteria bacterium]MCB4793297.1 trypsin-like peptidase domain-containing protein [Pseudomonas sp. NP21570]PKM02953.1 MAG: 2-alkenal reductase [Gammaproteobacteria bacterium HGW-Gammaproteobacteria-6]RRU72541.1 PDZ domain-containing protein [Stutze|tara:strand:- start:42941 stop:44095 length:1155 start_codon:yes stop_codon:yes gene_type:complete